HIIPAAISYQNRLIENVRGLKDVLGPEKAAKAAATQIGMIEEISEHLGRLKTLTDDMIEARKKANVIEDHREQAIAYCDQVKPYLDKIRYHANKLEINVDDELWPLPKLRELLFTR
ncbi:MAG TPA: glutamine synthetase type III, partial [Flavobacteriales bacterium]|nr:glutamine synthetase type III [Flavobacteriales bacterium]